MNLYDLTLDQLTELITGWGEKPYRARQIREWLYVHKVTDPDAMSNLPANLRQRLRAETRIGALTPVTEQRSSDGHTVKHLFRLDDGQLIESVLMAYADARQTACISTQAGCAMGLRFLRDGSDGIRAQPLGG